MNLASGMWDLKKSVFGRVESRLIENGREKIQDKLILSCMVN